MRRVLGLSLVLPLLFPLGVQGQTPEMEQMQFWVGEWAYEMGEASGRMEFELFGDHLIVGREIQNTGTGSTVRYLHVMGYDPEGGMYWWHAFVSSPSPGLFKGSLEGNTWTWVGEDSGDTKMRFIVATESDDQFQARWERSVSGGPWEVTVQATATRVR